MNCRHESDVKHEQKQTSCHAFASISQKDLTNDTSGDSSKTCKNSVQPSKPHFVELLEHYDFFIFDCDGTLWSGKQALTGAIRFIRELRSRGKYIFFVSNNATRMPIDTVQKAISLGFDVVETEVVTSGLVLSDFLIEYNRGNIIIDSSLIKQPPERIRKALVLGEQQLVTLLNKTGIETFGSPGPDPLDQRYSDGDYPPDDVDAVIVGYDSSLTYLRVDRAMRAIIQPKVLFLATNTDPAVPLGGKYNHPGAGITVGAVSIASETDPLIFGKPHKYMFDYLIKQILKQPSTNSSEEHSSPLSQSKTIQINSSHVHQQLPLSQSDLSFEMSNSNQQSQKIELPINQKQIRIEEIKKRCLMFGDRLDTDIQFGINNGMDSVLMLQGVTDAEKAEQSKIKPVYIAQNFIEILDE
ncbi:MAG: glycerol-3-phosphate phosphatase [Streblomastix strix]|uniref:Glycerol-3-phosphate phosphatase n=1 Tax=Streblomastix strix TaxID=222440 RepID=A0A5J4WT85_9EUKA|nr:MAG: glycerol-3-phosphate phosphatase [Streblomastix strix]